MPRYLFILPDVDAPAGGVNVALQMVEILHKNGIEANAVHASSRYEYPYFKNSSQVYFYPKLAEVPIRFMGKGQKIRTSVKGLSDLFKATSVQNKALSIAPEDVVVIPEFLYPEYSALFPKNKRILLVQGAYIFCQALSRDKKNDTHFIDSFHSIIATSEASQEAVLQFARRDSLLVSQSVSRDSLDAAAPKKRQIAYMPRKRTAEISMFLACLEGREDLAGWTFKPIEKMGMEEVDSILTDSLIFLSFSYKEGFGLPPAEAMAAGCIVIGYTGIGGEEYFEKGGAIAIPDGDISSFARELMSTLNEYDKNPARLDALRLQSSKYICETYNQEKMRGSLLSAWQAIGQQP